MTGWNMPPGCNVSDIPGFRYDERCDVCGRGDQDCLCPECPICGVQGEPRCYADGHLTLTEAQRISKLNAQVWDAQDVIQEQRYYAQFEQR